MTGKDRGTRTNEPSDFDRFMASAFLANDYLNTVNRAIELATDLNRFHVEWNDLLIKRLKPGVDLSVLSLAIGLTYAVQIITPLLAPLCPRALVVFLEKYKNTLSHVMLYLLSGNINEDKAKKYLQKLLDRYQEFHHTAGRCLGLPIEMEVSYVPEQDSQEAPAS
jgi:hypothetical protein